jgi:hypothetical protein
MQRWNDLAPNPGNPPAHALLAGGAFLTPRITRAPLKNNDAAIAKRITDMNALKTVKTLGLSPSTGPHVGHTPEAAGRRPAAWANR